ncbi:MAG: ferritin family protein [Sedimentisphaerales bacterium]|nr:ferritin family protein [Sedimentisphaerales bacterium]
MPRFHSANDILDFAIARENQAHEFYIRLERFATKPQVRRAIHDLAIDELQHAIRLEAIKAGETSFLDEDVGSLDIAENTPETELRPDMSYVDLLVVAMNREKAAFRLYSNLASIARNRQHRDTLLALARQEAQHKLRLEIEYDWEMS